MPARQRLRWGRWLLSCENEPHLDEERIAKSTFIETLLPFITGVESGKGIDNLRIQIDKAWKARKRVIRNK
jgi:hypothetical protein